MKWRLRTIISQIASRTCSLVGNFPKRLEDNDDHMRMGAQGFVCDHFNTELTASECVPCNTQDGCRKLIGNAKG